MTRPNDHSPQLEQPFLSHLIELRDRLLRVVLVVIAIFLCLFPFANELYHFIAEPLLRQAGGNMIAIDVASPFLTPFKLSLVIALFVAVPYILYQLWAFVAPALYQREKRLVFPLLLSSTVLFYMGMAFAYYVVFPLVFGFLTGVAPKGVEVMTDISRYLDFVLKMFFAFGVAFEVPVATIIVIWTGMTTAESLAAKRPYIIVAAFVIGMLLTPPDVISQTLLALPMWALFEIGLVMSRLYTKKPDEEGVPAQADDAVSENPVTATPAPTAPVKDEAPYRDLTESEMDAELDRIEAEERWLEHDNVDQEAHQEYEPFPEDADPNGSTEPKA